MSEWTTIANKPGENGSKRNNNKSTEGAEKETIITTNKTATQFTVEPFHSCEYSRIRKWIRKWKKHQRKELLKGPSILNVLALMHMQKHTTMGEGIAEQAAETGQREATIWGNSPQKRYINENQNVKN